MGKPLQHSCLENPMNCMKRQKDTTLKDELPRLVGAQYATGEERRNTPEGMKRLSQKRYSQCPAVDVSGGENKVRYCIAAGNVRSMSQGKLEVVKQEMARVNINILGISELKWAGMEQFNSDDNYICYCGQECLRNGAALIINKRA